MVRLHLGMNQINTNPTPQKNNLIKLLSRMFCLECERARPGFHIQVPPIPLEMDFRALQAFRASTKTRVLGYATLHTPFGLGADGKMGAWRLGLKKPLCQNGI